MAAESTLGTRGKQAALFGQALLAVIAAILVSSAITQPFTGLVVDAGIVDEGSPMAVVVRTSFQFLGFLLAAAGFLSFTDNWDLIRRTPVEVPRGVVLVVGGAIGLLALQFGVLYLFSLIGVSTGQNRAVVPGQRDPTYFLYMIAVSILLVGPAEEILFRGVVQGLFRRAWGAIPSILLASALFGLIHVPAVIGSPEQALLYAVVAAGLGCVLGYLYERTGHIAIPCLVHGLYNGAIYGIQYLGHVG